MKQQTVQFILLILVSVLFLDQSESKEKYQNEELIKQRIKQLYNKIQKLQYKKDKQFSLFPLLQFEQQKGLFPSYIKLNIIDHKNLLISTVLRRYSQIEDMNMFVTNFVIQIILETWEYGDIELNQESIEEGIKAVLKFKDHYKGDNSVIYSFWEQEKVKGGWRAQPHNLIKILDLVPGIPKRLEPFFKKRLGGIYYFINIFKQIKSVFTIPSDNDDSSINMVLAGYLKRNGKDIPELNGMWFNYNQDYEEYLKLLQKYAYRPFINMSSNTQNYSKYADYIDPRTYYVLAEYIDIIYRNATEQQDIPKLTLATTWLMDLDDEYQMYPNVKMPLHTNNVDLSVNANVLYSLTLYFLYVDTGNSTKFNIIRDMYLDIANLLKWAIHNKIVVNRPDISLVYYPSKYNFYWFVARTYAALKSYRELLLPLKEMNEVQEILEEVLLGAATNQILDEQANEGYWQEFLGNYAGKSRGEDRLFATAVALNALIDIWKQQSHIPQRIKQSIQKGINYILEQSDKLFVSKQNAFFSGSGKTNSTYPYFYPATLTRFINGTIIDPITANISSINLDLIHCFQGFTSIQQYQKMLKNQYFGQKLPEFHGFNDPDGLVFPYWSSPAITYSMTMLALTKYLHFQT